MCSSGERRGNRHYSQPSSKESNFAYGANCLTARRFNFACGQILLRLRLRRVALASRQQTDDKQATTKVQHATATGGVSQGPGWTWELPWFLYVIGGPDFGFLNERKHEVTDGPYFFDKIRCSGGAAVLPEGLRRTSLCERRCRPRRPHCTVAVS